MANAREPARQRGIEMEPLGVKSDDGAGQNRPDPPPKDLRAGSSNDGESPLHLAIFNEDLELVKELVSGGANPNARCTRANLAPAQVKEEKVLFYYAEYPLSLAACLGNGEIVEYLVEHGANLENKDTEGGNTVLHVLDIVGDDEAACSMARLVLKLATQTGVALALEEIENDAGLTPVMLAATCGNRELFQILIDHSRKHYALRNGSPECLYDVSDIDRRPDTGQNVYSLLDIVVYSDVGRFYYQSKIRDTEASTMIRAAPIEQLLEVKWRRMRWWFLGFTFLYLFHIGLFTACCWHRPLRNVVMNMSNGTNNITNGTDNVTVTVMEKVSWRELYSLPWNWVRVFELLTVIGIFGVITLVILLGREEYERFQFLKGHYSMTMWTYIIDNAVGYGVGNGQFLFVSAVYVLAVLILIPLRFTDSPREDVVMSIALVFGWMLLSYFSRGSEALGPFTIIIHRVLLKDIVRFLVFYSICLIGYTAAFYVTFEQAEEDLEQFSDFGSTFLTLFKLTIGVEDVAVLNKAPNPGIAISLYVSFLIFSFLLMSNLLIGMAGETLGVVLEAGWKKLWELQRAYLIILFERRLRYCPWQKEGEIVDLPGFDPNKRYLRVQIDNLKAGKGVHLTRSVRIKQDVPEPPFCGSCCRPSRCCGSCFRRHRVDPAGVA